MLPLQLKPLQNSKQSVINTGLNTRTFNFILLHMYFDGVEIKRDYYTNGQLSFEYNYKDGKLHGLSKEWYSSGAIGCERYFKNGKRHGPDKFWKEHQKLTHVDYYLYGNRVTEEEYKTHDLIEKLAELTEK